MAKRPTPSSKRAKPAPKRASKPAPKRASKPAPKRASKPAPKRASKPAPKRASKPARASKSSSARASRKVTRKTPRKAPPEPTGPHPHHIAAISAAVVALLGPLAIVRSITPDQSKPNRWVPHLQRPLLRSEHEPRRRIPLTRHPPR